MKKKGTHTTQKKYFGTVPRSEFLGFVLGYGIGLFVSGALGLESQYQHILFALVGLGIGYYIDLKYFQEPDEVTPESETTEAVQEAPEAAVPEPARTMEQEGTAPEPGKTMEQEGTVPVPERTMEQVGTLPEETGAEQGQADPE